MNSEESMGHFEILTWIKGLPFKIKVTIKCGFYRLCKKIFYKNNSQNICFAAKLVPVGYGIRKLQINAVIEDDKVNWCSVWSITVHWFSISQ